MTTSTTTQIKTTSYLLAGELEGAFIERGIRWHKTPAEVGVSDAWWSLAHKINKSAFKFEVTPDEAKELAAELDNMIDIQQDHMDDFEGKALMRAMQAMYRKVA